MGEENYWIKQQSTQAWVSWAGHAFETLCMMHIEQIKAGLGLSGVHTVQSQWAYRADTKDPQEYGAQIDLVIDRADGCINLCEIKFCNDEFTIERDYAEVLERKRNAFARQTKTKKALFTTLITPYGAKKNMHYLSCVDSQLILDDLFKEVR